MTQEEKQLLLQDLSSRLQFGLKVCYINLSDEMPKVWDLIGMHTPYLADILVEGSYRFAAVNIEESIRPYLRPLSSMTDDEFGFLQEHLSYDFTRIYSGKFDIINDIHLGNSISIDDMAFLLDYLDKHHFDYRGLIEKGLAIEAPEDMYSKIE